MSIVSFLPLNSLFLPLYPPLEFYAQQQCLLHWGLLASHLRGHYIHISQLQIIDKILGPWGLGPLVSPSFVKYTNLIMLLIQLNLNSFKFNSSGMQCHLIFSFKMELNFFKTNFFSPFHCHWQCAITCNPSFIVVSCLHCISIYTYSLAC